MPRNIQNPVFVWGCQKITLKLGTVMFTHTTVYMLLFVSAASPQFSLFSLQQLSGTLCSPLVKFEIYQSVKFNQPQHISWVTK